MIHTDTHMRKRLFIQHNKEAARMMIESYKLVLCFSLFFLYPISRHKPRKKKKKTQSSW